MFDELRDRIKNFLNQHPLGIITTSGTTGAWAVPAWQINQGLEIICLLPRWSDVLYYIEQDPQVLLVIVDTQSSKLRWLYYRGTAARVEDPNWCRILSSSDRQEGSLSIHPGDEYAAIHIQPQRLDLIDECHGWGARETLEF